jgi:hypothetical protein
MYVKLENNVPTEWPVSEDRIRFDNKSVSFPRNMSNYDVTAFGFAKFEYSDKPDYDIEYQNCEEVTPTLTNGKYVQTWMVTDKYDASQRQNYDAQKEIDRISSVSEINRQIRDSLLLDTDWWALSDVTMTAEQRSYRQSLRDITVHDNWPDLQEEDWPTKP